MTTQERVREIRKATGLSQVKFGQKYGIPRRTVEDWEAGVMNPPAYVIDFLERVVKDDLEK